MAGKRLGAEEISGSVLQAGEIVIDRRNPLVVGSVRLLRDHQRPLIQLTGFRKSPLPRQQRRKPVEEDAKSCAFRSGRAFGDSQRPAVR